MRAALYARVSTEEQAVHGLSVEAQLAALEEWAADKTIVDHYVDLGISARKPASRRPELQRLLRDVEAGKIDLIAFTKLDRWFRNVKEYYKVEEILEQHDVAWTAIHEDYETQSASGKLKVNIVLAFSESEADATSERTKRIVERKRQKGEFCSGNVPVGLTLVDKRLAPGEDAPLVKHIFQLFTSCGTVKGTQRQLLEEGRQIGESSLRYLLDNENYYNAGVIDGATWERVRQLRSIPRPRVERTNRTYLFTGLAFCSCGRRLAGMYSGGRRYLKCPGHYQDNTCGNARCYREETIEAKLLEDLRQYADGVEVEMRDKSNPIQSKADIRRKMDKLTDLYMSDLIDRERYEREYAPLRDKLRAIDARPRAVNRGEVMALLDVYKTMSDRAKRVYWYNLIRRIEIDGDDLRYQFVFMTDQEWHEFCCHINDQ